MRATLLGMFLLVTPALFATNCSLFTQLIPAGQTKLDTGTATAQKNGTATVVGGQNAYVRITNAKAPGITYQLTITQNGQTVCTDQFLLPARTSRVLTTSLSAEPPITWNVAVSVGQGSGTGMLTYDVYSRPVKDFPICATANQGKTAALTCSGGKIVSIQFASYGTPTGSCQHFAIDPSCNEPNSVAFVSFDCVGHASCAVPAQNGAVAGSVTLTDPCVGHAKHLSIQATCRQF